MILSGVESRSMKFNKDETTANAGKIDPSGNDIVQEDNDSSCCGSTEKCENRDKIALVHELGDEKTEENEQMENGVSQLSEAKKPSGVLLERQNRQLRNRVRSLRQKLYKRRNDQKKSKRTSK